MQEYRYKGLNIAGKPVEGTFFSKSPIAAQRRISEFAKKKQIKISKLERKATFVYKVHKGDGKAITGEQKAFSQQDVHDALLKMGLHIISIRKRLISSVGKVPTNDVVVFIRLCTNMLKENFPYDEILQLLMNDTENKVLRDAIKDIHKSIKMGKEGAQIYGPHSKIFGTFATTMLSIASTSGNMAEMYENTAKYLERDFEFKKSIKSALFMPAIVFFFIILTFLFYIMYIFPQTTNMLMKYNIAVPPMTQASMNLSDFLIANIVWVVLAVVVPVIGFLFFVRSPKGKVIFHKKMITIPVIGSLLHKSSIEIFARVINALYSGAGDNIGAIKTAAEACRNSYIEAKVKTIVIPTMLREGRTLTDSLVLTGVFPVNAINRLRAGEETGTIKESARQLADYYEREVSYKMTSVVDWIQLNIAIVVTILIIIITLISSELGFVSPDSLVNN